MRTSFKFGLGLLVLACLGWLSWLSYLDWRTQAEQQRLQAQPAPTVAAMPERLDWPQQLADLQHLASDEMAGRGTGQAGGQLAQSWLVQQFELIGLAPAGTEGYRQPYQASSGKAAEHQGAANVLGQIAGTDPQLPLLVITAHYDHLGLHEGQIYHGADDNASGVAALLALARYFKQHPPRHTLWFAAVDHEERGMWGSKMLFEQKLLQPEQIKLNINLDMLSRDTERQLYAVGAYHQPALLPVLQQLQQQSSVRLLLGYDRPQWLAGNTPDWTSGSDHAVFHQQGVDFVYFGVPDHPDYHQPSDTFAHTDQQFYREVSETVLSTLLLFDAI